MEIEILFFVSLVTEKALSLRGYVEPATSHTCSERSVGGSVVEAISSQIIKGSLVREDFFFLFFCL